MESIYVVTMWVVPSDESKLARWSEYTHYFSSLDRAKEYIRNWYGDETNLDPILKALDANGIIGGVWNERSDILLQFVVAAYDGETHKGNIRIDICKDEVDLTYGDS